MQNLQSQVRIFNRPERVARIETDAHEIASSFLHQSLQFTGLHVAGVILDRDFYPVVSGLRFHALQNTNCVFDARFNRGLAVFAAS